MITRSAFLPQHRRSRIVGFLGTVALLCLFALIGFMLGLAF